MSVCAKPITTGEGIRTSFLGSLANDEGMRYSVSSGVRIPSREIVPAGRIFPPFFPRMGGPEHCSPLLSCAFLATGKVVVARKNGDDSLLEEANVVPVTRYQARTD